MIGWLKTNLATILISALLIAAVAFVIIKMIRDRKNGKSACSCGCADCPMKDRCGKK